MKKHLTNSGNGWELYLNTPLLKLIGISAQERKIVLSMQKNILSICKYNINEVSHENSYMKNLVKRGGGYAIFLPQPILELLNIYNPEDDFLEIEIDENKLLIKKAID